MQLTDEIKSAVRFMREQKVSSFRLDGLEVTFQPQSFGPASHGAFLPEPEKTEEQIKRESDDLLYYSSGA